MYPYEIQHFMQKSIFTWNTDLSCLLNKLTCALATSKTLESKYHEMYQVVLMNLKHR